MYERGEQALVYLVVGLEGKSGAVIQRLAWNKEYEREKLAYRTWPMSRVSGRCLETSVSRNAVRSAPVGTWGGGTESTPRIQLHHWLMTPTHNGLLSQTRHAHHVDLSLRNVPNRPSPFQPEQVTEFLITNRNSCSLSSSNSRRSILSSSSSAMATQKPLEPTRGK